MNRSELLARASSSLGRPVPDHVLAYALRIGRIRPAKKLADGWFAYSPRNVSELVRHCQARSHRQKVG